MTTPNLRATRAAKRILVRQYGPKIPPTALTSVSTIIGHEYKELEDKCGRLEAELQNASPPTPVVAATTPKGAKTKPLPRTKLLAALRSARAWGIERSRPISVTVYRDLVGELLGILGQDVSKIDAEAKAAAKRKPKPKGKTK